MDLFKKYDKPAAYLLIGIGCIQLIFLSLVILGISEEIFSVILYEAFHFAALYIPFLSFAGAYLILKKPLNKRLFYYTAASLVIFFPVSSVIKILFSNKRDPFIDTLHYAFDRPGTNIGSLLILLAIILILVLSTRIVVKMLLGEKLIEDVEQVNSEEAAEESINNEPLETKTEEDLVTKREIFNNPFDIKVDDDESYGETNFTDQEPDDVFSEEAIEESFDEEFNQAEVVDNLNEEGIDVEITSDSYENDDFSEIDKIKQEISEYYIEEEKNIPFDEPEFPEVTDEVDIDAYDKSNELLSEVVEQQLSQEEEEYINSFDEVETFKPSEASVLTQEDPAYDFLADDSNEEYYDEYSETDDFMEIQISQTVEIDDNETSYAEHGSYHSDESYVDDEDYVGEESYVDDEDYVGEESYVDDEDYAEDTFENEEIYVEESFNDREPTSGYQKVLEEPVREEKQALKRKVLMPHKTYEELNKGVDYSVPVKGLLSNNIDNSYMEIDEATKRSAAILEQTLEEFNIKGKVTGIKKGPVITMFELLPAPGVKLSKIVNLSDNIALGLAAPSVRIVAPIPGKHAVGIEVPNKKRAVVPFSELIDAEDEAYDDAAVPIVLGKNISGENKIIDLARTPHLLIAGATGAGKSVCVNSLICSILCKRSHNDVKLIMVDPKIVELKLYNGIPHLLTPVITDPKRAFQAIQWCLYEMERRYALLDSMGVRDIKSYNKRIKEQKIATTKLPYMVLIVDEFADLMATSGKELEGILARLAAMSRAVGIHLVLATQRPSIDVITGLIKANFPSRIAFMVSSKTDSRIILDTMGAEKLLGRGDMLFTSSWDPFPVRIQGSFLSDNEVESVVDYVKGLGEPEYIDDEIFIDDEEEEAEAADTVYGDDPLFNRALEIVINAKKASASFLQRRLKIGYNRAARLVEEMEDRGIIGPQNGSKPREILRIPDSHKEVGDFV